MSMWKEFFEIYQSVQSGEDLTSSIAKTEENPTQSSIKDRTVYVFAYLDDGKGNTPRSIPIKDRLTMIELKQRELEDRYKEIEERLEELTSED